MSSHINILTHERVNYQTILVYWPSDEELFAESYGSHHQTIKHHCCLDPVSNL